MKLGGMAIARVENKTTPFYSFSDHLGSPVAVWKQGGSIERERYTPFGITMDNPASLKDQAGFTGHIKDSATGLNYMQARYYDPVMGRFLSIDPVTFMTDGRPGMFNRYSYTLNDPVNMYDPNGESPACWTANATGMSSGPVAAICNFNKGEVAAVSNQFGGLRQFAGRGGLLGGNERARAKLVDSAVEAALIVTMNNFEEAPDVLQKLAGDAGAFQLGAGVTNSVIGFAVGKGAGMKTGLGNLVPQ